jgi:hypothetical protein
LIGVACSATEHVDPTEGAALAGPPLVGIVHRCTIAHLHRPPAVAHESSKFNEKRGIPVLVRPQQIGL